MLRVDAVTVQTQQENPDFRSKTGWKVTIAALPARFSPDMSKSCDQEIYGAFDVAAALRLFLLTRFIQQHRRKE